MNKAENNNDFSTAVSEIWFNWELFKIISEAVRLGWKKVRHALIDNIHLEIREKTDKTLVTQVDEEWEKVITKRIKRSSTGTIRGEEFWETVGDKKYIWYIDPIDGTSSFSRWQQYSTVLSMRL